MVKKTIVAISIFILAFSTTVYANDNSLGLKISTLGLGLEAERSFSESIGGRVGVNYFTFEYSGTEDDIKYDFDINLLSLSALLDWHPFKGSFRISGGVIYNGNDIDAKAKSSDTYDIGDLTFSGDQVGTLTGNIDFNDLAPYLGLGWCTAFGRDKNIGFLFELGVMYQDLPKVDLSADGPISGVPVFQNELAKEEENLKKEMDKYKFYPVIAIRLSYRL